MLNGKRLLARLAWTFLACVLLTPVWPVAAQPPVTRDSLGSVSRVESVLQQGLQLESQRRWNEAFVHYEGALRENPGHQGLEQRLDLVRIHMDVARRYTDVSFVRGLRDIGVREALGLYNEIMLKIQTHHVQAPEWRRLFLHGLTTLEAALEEPQFVAVNRIAQPQQLAGQRQELRAQAERFRVEDRRDAYNAAAFCAQWAERNMGLAQTTVLLEFISGALGALDEYSAFLTGSQLDEVFSQIEGNFVGLGVELKSRDDGLHIVHVIPGGPASEGGIQPGDRIVAVDGRRTSETPNDQAADLLKGQEGSQVEVDVVGGDGQTRTLRLTRRRVDVPSVDSAKLVDNELGVGYFRLTSFQKTTSRDVDQALWQLHRQGMRALIIDLRGNPGGLLNAAVEVADKFMSQGGIVSTRGRSAGEDYDYRAHSVGTWQLPLVVLIDGESASASEIFAGAIHDSRRGIVVGQRSFGKGSVQGIFPLQSAQAGVRLTTAKFYSPSGQPISKRGVSPDVVVQSVARPADGLLLAAHEDPVLRAALQVAREQFTQK